MSEEPAGGQAPQEGWIAPDVQREPGSLRLLHADVSVTRRTALTGDSPADVQQRLRAESSRFRGARAVAIRREPIPAAYRVFYRQIGLDPDVQRTPIEEAVLERMLRGAFPSGGLLADVLLIAMLDTSVPVWALDAASVDGRLGIRASIEGETLGRSPGAPVLPAGSLVVADSAVALAVLFGQVAPGHEPHARSREVTLFAAQVAGVPSLYVEEALWSASAALKAP
jgi:DNA/RNA-binding domain of Phe-tRNA-synthetase-like protein